MKIYLVTSGVYSDYKVVGVFSSEDKAKKCLAKYKYLNDNIEEYELDRLSSLIEIGMNLYMVSMSRDGNVLDIEEIDDPGTGWEEDNETWCNTSFGEPVAVPWKRFFVWAKTEQEAIKIANEQGIRMTLKADGLV